MYTFCLHRSNRSLLLLFLLLNVAAITSCRKDEWPGSVGGSLSYYPLETELTLHAANTGELRYTTSPVRTGKFVFPSVLPGEYTLRVKNTPLYSTSAEIPVKVISGEHTELPMVMLEYNASGQKGSLRFTLEGKEYTADTGSVFLNYAFSVFYLVGKSTDQEDYSFRLNMGEINGTGTFMINNQLRSMSLEYHMAGSLVNAWRAKDDSTASVTILALDPVTRTASGTFTASFMRPDDTFTVPRAITGSFTDVAY